MGHTINKWLNFGEDPDHRLDTGIVFLIRHYREIQKVNQKSDAASNHSFTLIRQMAAVVIWLHFLCRSRTDLPDGGTDVATLVRRALAEVCTVPVLLVKHFIITHITEVGYHRTLAVDCCAWSIWLAKRCFSSPRACSFFLTQHSRLVWNRQKTGEISMLYAW